MKWLRNPAVPYREGMKRGKKEKTNTQLTTHTFSATVTQGQTQPPLVTDCARRVGRRAGGGGGLGVETEGSSCQEGVPRWSAG